MATRAQAGQIFSHWYRLLDGLQTSPLEFYQRIEQALESRQLPDASHERVEWGEAGVFSARREYLRVTRARHTIDICGAPFGSGFFVSWWLAEARPAPLIPSALTFITFVFLWQLAGLWLTIVAFVLGFFVLGAVMSQGEAEWHGQLLAIPVLGALWERFFLPPTYYRIDTALMFQGAVHGAVLEVVDGFTKANGIRALTDDERKPILRDFHTRLG
jgi:hypothetical protein